MAAADGLAAPHLAALERLCRRAPTAGEPEFMANVGWVVAAPADSELVIEVMRRVVGVAASHPLAPVLARFAIARSARCSRRAAEYLYGARAILQLQQQAAGHRYRIPLWLGLLYVVRGPLSEARRHLEAAARLAPAEGVVADSVAFVQALAAGFARIEALSGPALDPAPGQDPMVNAVREAVRGGAVRPGEDGIRARLRLQIAGPRAPAGQDAQGGRAPTGVHLHVRAVAGLPVVVEGGRSRQVLDPLEAELLLSLLARLAPARSQGAGAAGDPAGRRWVGRDEWAGTIWPVHAASVGRIHALFSAAIRSLRAKAERAAGGPVIAATHRYGYQLTARAEIDLEADVYDAAAVWLLSRLDCGGGGEAP